MSLSNLLRLTIVLALLYSIFVAEAAYSRDDLSCPDGAYPTGGTPPAAMSWGCLKSDAGGEWVRHGWWIEFYLNGQKKQEGEYRNGEKVGRWTWWYPNSLKMQEGAYLYGLPTGSWSFWSAAGAPVEVRKDGDPKSPVPRPRVEFVDFARNMRREFH